MAVTILQIAERLQLSHSTVSRVLNNKPNTFIAEETKRRVLEVAREMGYRPNLAARSLRDARSNMIGIFSSPYFGIWSGGAIDLTNAAAEVLHARDLHLFFALVAEDGTEHKAMPVWRFDGAILLQRPPQATIDHLITVDRPFVAINERITGGVSILADENDGVRQAMDHLWELGHRTIAYAGPARWHFQHYSVSERYDAYSDYLRQRGIPVLSSQSATTTSEDRFEWLRHGIQEDGVTAVLAYDHLVLLEVLAAAQKQGLRIPQDLSLVCFNDDIITSKLNPPITVITPQVDMMGREAGKLLLARMDAGEGALPLPGSPFPMEVRVPERLIVRESSAQPQNN